MLRCSGKPTQILGNKHGVHRSLRGAQMSLQAHTHGLVGPSPSRDAEARMRQLLEMGQARRATGPPANSHDIRKVRILPWSKRAPATPVACHATLEITTANGTVTAIGGTFMAQLAGLDNELEGLACRIALALMAYSDHETPCFEDPPSILDAFSASFSSDCGFEQMDDFDTHVLELLRYAEAIDTLEYAPNSTTTHKLPINMLKLLKFSTLHYEKAKRVFAEAVQLFDEPNGKERVRDLVSDAF